MPAPRLHPHHSPSGPPSTRPAWPFTTTTRVSVVASGEFGLGVAIEFAERFALEHRAMDAEFFGRLRAHYDDAEIVELGGTVAFCLGIGRVYAVLDIANECPVVH